MKSIQKVTKEIPGLTSIDCFTIVSKNIKNFDSMMHYHDVYELNLLINATNAKRIVGDHTEYIGSVDLVLIGPNVSHVWITDKCDSDDIKEVTIQFPKDLFDDKLLKRSHFFLIKNMLKNAHRGVIFSALAIKEVTDRILQLDKKSGFDSVLEFLSIFHDLSISRNMEMLASPGFSSEKNLYENGRIEKVFDYLNANYEKQITLADIAHVANMAETSISRLIKNQTGNTFVDHLNHIRLSNAAKMLIDSTYTISEIANFSGYLNISNFNRIFKSKKNCTPKEYRETYAVKKRIFV
jgi:AraC-like DNA-binding protein